MERETFRQVFGVRRRFVAVGKEMVMNFNSMKAMAIAAGLTACCLLNGCGWNYSMSGTVQSDQAEPKTSETTQFTVVGTNGGPLQYQWYYTNGNEGGQPVEAGSHGTLYYQWYKNTNGTGGSPH